MKLLLFLFPVESNSSKSRQTKLVFRSPIVSWTFSNQSNGKKKQQKGVLVASPPLLPTAENMTLFRQTTTWNLEIFNNKWKDKKKKESQMHNTNNNRAKKTNEIKWTRCYSSQQQISRNRSLDRANSSDLGFLVKSLDASRLITMCSVTHPFQVKKTKKPNQISIFWKMNFVEECASDSVGCKDRLLVKWIGEIEDEMNWQRPIDASVESTMRGKKLEREDPPMGPSTPKTF